MLALIAGCDSPGADQGDPSLLDENPDGAGAPFSGVVAADLGPVLADGQTLRHEFRVRNRTEAPMVLRTVQASTPCCTEAEPLPTAPIAPGDEARIGVLFRVGTQSGRKRVAFEVETDSEQLPRLLLSLTATLHPACEVRPIDRIPPTLAAGRSVRGRYRVACHRGAGMGRGLPDACEVDGAITLAAIGEPTETRRAGGLVELARDLDIEVRSSVRAGLQRGAIRLRWSDGETLEYPLSWVVEPALTVVPSALVLQAGRRLPPQTVLLRSADRPFRILAVSGDGLTGTPEWTEAPAAVQKLTLTLDTSSGAAVSGTRIVVRTDHPDQPEVALDLVVLPTVDPEASR